MRIKLFENYPSLHTLSNITLYSSNLIMIQGVYIPGSLSFVNVMVLKSQGATANTQTYRFALYSLNGSTLSLANSASKTDSVQALAWVTLVTSATQDITPGNWYLAFMSATAGANGSLMGNPQPQAPLLNYPYGGVFVRGYYPTTTTDFPASIATSDLSKEGSAVSAGAALNFPYILITA